MGYDWVVMEMGRLPPRKVKNIRALRKLLSFVPNPHWKEAVVHYRGGYFDGFPLGIEIEVKDGYSIVARYAMRIPDNELPDTLEEVIKTLNRWMEKVSVDWWTETVLAISKTEKGGDESGITR